MRTILRIVWSIHTVLPQKSPRFNAFFVFRVFNPFSTTSFLFHCTMNRTPLSSISGNHRRHHQYILYQKGLICEVIDGGLTSSRIEKQYRVPKNFVRYVLSTYKSQSTEISNSRSDRLQNAHNSRAKTYHPYCVSESQNHIQKSRNSDRDRLFHRYHLSLAQRREYY